MGSLMFAHLMERPVFIEVVAGAKGAQSQLVLPDFVVLPVSEMFVMRQSKKFQAPELLKYLQKIFRNRFRDHFSIHKYPKIHDHKIR